MKHSVKSLSKPSGKKVSGQKGRQGTQLTTIVEPDEVINHYSVSLPDNVGFELPLSGRNWNG